MEIERNVIFLYPLSAKLKELKDEIEKDESCILYELDDLNEFGQLIGVSEHSIVFSSDLKKTQSYLVSYKAFTKSKQLKSILVNDIDMPQRTFRKMQKLGLDEVLKEDSHLKSLTHKVQMFFRPFEEKLRKEIEAKNKPITGLLKMKKSLNAQEKKEEEDKEKANSIQRVEKTAIFDEEEGNIKKRKHSGFSDDFLLGGNTSNFDLKKNTSGEELMKSPFDSMQRKKVALFEPIEDKPKLKNSNFVPIVGELSKNPHKSIDLQPPGELNREKQKSHDFQETEFNKKNIDFKEVEREIGKKKVNFQDVERDINKRKVDFEEFETELNKKKTPEFELEEDSKKVRKKFEEVDIELEKKKVNFEQVELDLERKKKEIELLETELNRKKVNFEENLADAKKKSQLLDELIDLNKKKSNCIDEIEIDLNKKKALFEEYQEEKSLNKLSLSEEKDLNKKNIDLDLLDEELNKKKGTVFLEQELSKKSNNFKEVEAEEKDRKGFEEISLEEEKKKHSSFSLEDKVSKKGMAFLDSEKEKKNSSFQEINIEKNLVGKVNQSTQDKNLPKDIDKIATNNNKNIEEQTLDYSKFKKEYQDKNSETKKVSDVDLDKDKLEKKLQEPEYSFFENQSFSLEYLILFNDFLMSSNLPKAQLYKFIHFALLKDFNAALAIYVLDQRVEDYMKTGFKSFKKIYDGFSDNKNSELRMDIDFYLKDNFEYLTNVKIPTWTDETFQEVINDFYYPFYEDGSLMGYGFVRSLSKINGHKDSSKVELIVMSLKSLILSEYDTNGTSL